MMKLLLFFIISFNVVCLVGCRQQQKQETTRVRTKLVLDLFKAFQKKDHKVALNKVTRLRQLDKTNMFLSRLEATETFNIIILQIQEQINQNNIAAAINTIETALKKHGRQKQLIEVESELRQLNKLQKYVHKVTHPENAFDLAKNSFKLEKIMKQYKPAIRLKSAIARKMKEAESLHALENKRALYYLHATIDEFKADSSDLAAVSLAVSKSLSNEEKHVLPSQTKSKLKK